jgi:hypothetical protein
MANEKYLFDTNALFITLLLIQMVSCCSLFISYSSQHYTREICVLAPLNAA